MTSIRPLILVAALAGASPAIAQSFPAQPLQMVPQPTPDADALANAMRRLGANPRDLFALIEAGELSLKLGDVNAAAALFKRADMIDPMNGRVKAGMARILVSQERPGEALRYFDQATGYGLDPRSFAGDRGLAYDLIGEHDRAQRDYRLALKVADSAEVQRRYALSLGISGKRDAAIAEIDALLRKNDRGAWRARAFILAMNGDVPGAEKIAQTMMPQGMGAALGPFFTRLASLPQGDRAFAVHFGELRPTPARLADARLTPPLPVLGPDPTAPVQVAAVTPRAAPVKRDRRAERAEARRVQLAQRAADKARRQEARRVQLAQREAARRGTRVADGVAYGPSRAVVQPLPGRTLASRPPVQTAALVPTTIPRAAAPAPTPVVATPTPAPTASTAYARTTAAPVPSALGSEFPSASVATPTPAASVPVAPPTATPMQVASVPAVVAAGAAASASGATPPPSSGTPTAPASVAPTAAPTQVATVLGPPNAPTPLDAPAATQSAALTPRTPATPQPGFSTFPATPPQTTVAAATTLATPAQASFVGGASSPVPPATASSTITAAPPVVAKMNEDTILARIMAGISIPAEELGVGPVRPPAPAPGTTVATPASIASAEEARRNAEDARRAQQANTVAKPAGVAATRPAAKTTKVAAAAEPDVPATAAKPGTRAARAATEDAALAKPGSKTAKTLAKTEAEPLDPKAAARKAAADKKAAEAKKLGDAKKAEEKKKAAEEARLAKADPPRIWVQVAGGANEGDLPKAWGAVKAKAPALAGKAAYSTPLRATNRVVTGPFKTDAEARAFVNTLAKQGISAFPFTSEKGQKMTKLGGK